MLDTKDTEKVIISDDEDDVVIINSDNEDTIKNTKSIKFKLDMPKTKKTTEGIKRSVQLIKFTENIHSLKITQSGKITRRHVECVINIKDETEEVDLSKSNNINPEHETRRKCKKTKVCTEKVDCAHNVTKVERILPKCGRHSCGNKILCRKNNRVYKCVRRRYTKLRRESNVNNNYRTKVKNQPILKKSKSPFMVSMSDLSLPSCLDSDKDYVMYEDIISDDEFSSDRSEQLEMLIKRTKQREKTWTFSSNEVKPKIARSTTQQKVDRIEATDMDISLDSASTVLLDEIGTRSKYHI